MRPRWRSFRLTSHAESRCAGLSGIIICAAGVARWQSSGVHATERRSIGLARSNNPALQAAPLVPYCEPPYSARESDVACMAPRDSRNAPDIPAGAFSCSARACRCPSCWIRAALVPAPLQGGRPGAGPLVRANTCASYPGSPHALHPRRARGEAIAVGFVSSSPGRRRGRKDCHDHRPFRLRMETCSGGSRCHIVIDAPPPNAGASCRSPQI